MPGIYLVDRRRRQGGKREGKGRIKDGD